jgi:uncharacterized protein YkwD
VSRHAKPRGRARNASSPLAAPPEPQYTEWVDLDDPYGIEEPRDGRPRTGKRVGAAIATLSLVAVAAAVAPTLAEVDDQSFRTESIRSADPTGTADPTAAGTPTRRKTTSRARTDVSTPPLASSTPVAAPAPVDTPPAETPASTPDASTDDPPAEPENSEAPQPPKPSASTSAPAPSKPSPPPEPPAPSSEPPPSDDAVAAVLALVNQERAAAGCGAVRDEPRLSEASRKHSADMKARGYFSHTSPDGVTPWDRARAAGYDDPAAENIARGQPTPEAVVDAWMDSPGHRANILNCGHRSTGLGMVTGSGGPWWTQMFGWS